MTAQTSILEKNESGIGLGDRKTARMEGKMMLGQKEVAEMATAQTFWYLH